MTLVMYDSVDLSQIPSNAEAVAAYCDGRFANVAEARDRFPHAHILSIAVFAEHDADCLDIETGDATPGQASAWFLRQQARGVTRPCLYASVSVMENRILQALSGVARSSLRLWSAHYTGTPHTCGPHSCGLVSIDMDGTQWTDQALGRNLDQSLLAADFFGAVPPPPTGWTASMIANLPLLIQGATGDDVRTMQGLLIARKHPVNVDGDFGPVTQKAVLAAQADYRLAQDGRVGPLTWTALVTGRHG